MGSGGGDSSASPRLGRCQDIFRSALAIRSASAAKMAWVCEFSEVATDERCILPSPSGSMMGREGRSRSTMLIQLLSFRVGHAAAGQEDRGPGSLRHTRAGRARGQFFSFQDLRAA